MTLTDRLGLGRADRTAAARWFWTIDRTLLSLLLVLIGLGIIAVAAASPAAAFRYSDANTRLDPLHFLQRQFFWVAIGLPVLLGISMLSKSWAKRVAILGFGFFFLLLMLVPLIGHEVNGAVRWVMIGSFQLQPVEFLKPCFIVATALLFAARFEDRDLPVIPIGAALLGVMVVLLVGQPDFGQAALIVAIWVAQACLAGMSLWVVGGIIGGGIGGLALAYQFESHVRKRLDGFLHGEGDTYQVDRALDCFKSGGLFGTGPGEGVVKFKLPEPQTDYIFSVIGEEFGVIACIALAILYLAIVTRVLLQLVEEDDPFTLLAAVGLVAQFGGQAVINMAVNLALAPSKGMTLPFISHGGSSFIATAFGMGLLLALTRRNRHIQASPYLRGVPA
ncbi:peptidoglycan glycosyltransferase FtsW [Sandaracinobacteroides saxicola]|uniref:Probable peptidoglycan glycosyltransferase FtsW n=1 Tax=Sandaracinobacteroides saxicola TaxID=2759707 RepID=A0A7G5IG84_9SPHN|nr:putative peptidoglycan glycosyltransferase FtsW [Sandaracinobacteroides saxicola]QMW22376.1 cell division protein FtsW [Sandaracinobacteroides saxicola]